MKELLNERLRTLKEEYSKGQQQLVQLEERKQQLNQTIQRISGAIQVLEEILNSENSNQE